MGRTNERPSAKGLLRERAPRRDGGRFARFVRNLFRNNRRPGVLLAGCGKHLEADRARSAGSSIGRSADLALAQGNPKSQAPNLKQISMVKSQIPRSRARES